jgi:hypothetical protein
LRIPFVSRVQKRSQTGRCKGEGESNKEQDKRKERGRSKTRGAKKRGKATRRKARGEPSEKRRTVCGNGLLSVSRAHHIEVGEGAK